MAESGPLTMVGSKGELDFATGDMLDASGESFGTEIQLTIDLTPDAGNRLASFSAAHVGQEVSLETCGTQIARIRVVEPIRGGSISIGGLGEEQALAIVSVLLGEADCAEGT